MSTVQPPPPPTTPPAATPPAAALPLLTVKSPPPALSALAPGTPVTALVTSLLANGGAEIETTIGKFLVDKTSLPIKTAQPLVLQVAQNPGKGVITLHVLEIAGKPVHAPRGTVQASAGQTVTTSPGTTQLVNQPTITPTANVNLLVGSTINAISLTPITPNLSAPFNATLPTPAGQLTTQTSPLLQNTPNASTPTQVTTANIAPGQQINAPQPGMQQIPGLSGTSAPGLPQTGFTDSGQPRVFPAGSQFSLTIQNIQPVNPSQAGGISPLPAPSTPFSVDGVISGQVTSHTATGQPVVRTHFGSFFLDTSHSLPVRTELTLKINTLPEPGVSPKSIPPALQRVGMLMSQSWPSLDEGLNALQAADPVLSQQIQTVLIPKADVKLTATTLFFLSAIRGGDVRGWLGDNATRILDRLRPDIMRQLRNDFRLFSDLDDGAETRSPSEWRGTLVPFLSGNELEHLRLFTRHLGEEDGDENSRKGIRFLIDIHLSNIGRFQLDGIAETGERRLDMIVRTASALPDRVRADLMTLFAEANELVGMHGGMIFQASPDSFVEPLEEEPRMENAVGIIV